MAPKNSPAAVISMLKRTGCHRIISHSPLEPVLSAVQEQLIPEGYALNIEGLLSLEVVFPTLCGEPSDSPEPYPPSPVSLTMEDICLYQHSSGSTGFPKPVPQRYRGTLQIWNSCAC